MRIVVFCTVLTAVLASSALAQEEPLVTDRPDFTEAAVTIGKGRFQVETGVTAIQGRGGAREFGTEALLRYGVAARSEIRLGLPAYSTARSDGVSQSGLGDTYAGAKFQLGPTRSGLDISVIPAVFLPTGKREFSSRSVDPEVKLCLSKDLTQRMALSGMLYASYPTVDGDRNETLQTTLSLGYAITERVGSFYELADTYPRHGGPEHLIHTGVTYQPTHNTQWDVHFGFGLNTNAPVSFLAGGYAIRF